MFLLYI